MAESAPEVIIFEFIRHLQSGNSAAVWRTLLREGDGGESLLFPLLALLTREARLLWQIQAGENVWLPQQTANSNVRWPPGWVRPVWRICLPRLWEAEWAV